MVGQTDGHMMFRSSIGQKYIYTVYFFSVKEMYPECSGLRHICGSLLGGLGTCILIFAGSQRSVLIKRTMLEKV